MNKGPIFQSFLQAGFECSTHKLKNGKRLDLVSSTGHDRFADKDYERLKDVGILTVREGLRWHLIEHAKGSFNFDSVRQTLDAAQESGIQVIWDIFHFGWPDHYDIFDRAWVDAFAELAAAFARFLRRYTSNTSFIAPVNEISFVSWAGGDVSYLNPFKEGRGPELKRQLVRAFIAASQAIRSELPNARLVSPEPVIHIAGDPNRPDDVRQAEEYRGSMFEAWDMITGRAQPELAGDESYLEIIGINYYDRNQWWNYGKTIRRGEPEYRPFSEILQEVYLRYGRPMFIAETGTENSDRPAWFAYICEEVRAAIGAGVPLHGICLYPILNHPGWDDDRHCYNGLWDYPQADGSREIYEPLAQEIKKQERIRKETQSYEPFILSPN